jgi:hypothetical protein
VEELNDLGDELILLDDEEPVKCAHAAVRATALALSDSV